MGVTDMRRMRLSSQGVSAPLAVDQWSVWPVLWWLGDMMNGQFDHGVSVWIVLLQVLEGRRRMASGHSESQVSLGDPGGGGGGGVLGGPGPPAWTVDQPSLTCLPLPLVLGSLWPPPPPPPPPWSLWT